MRHFIHSRRACKLASQYEDYGGALQDTFSLLNNKIKRTVMDMFFSNLVSVVVSN